MARISKKADKAPVRAANEVAVENNYVEVKNELTTLGKIREDCIKVMTAWDKNSLTLDEVMCILASYIKD